MFCLLLLHHLFFLAHKELQLYELKFPKLLLLVLLLKNPFCTPQLTTFYSIFNYILLSE